MSADPQVKRYVPPAGGLAEAIYFSSGDQRVFGWLHRPAPGTALSTGLVICKPFGYEAICAHRSVRAFAEAAAAIGVPTLRFDYLGTGDSADIEPEADQLEVWSEDVLAAVAELQSRSGVERVCLLGIRLGALLATLAALRCKSVASLILIAPIFSGRRYLRELRTTRMAAYLSAFLDGGASGPGSMEVSGFTLSAASLAALAKIDLASLTTAPAAEMLVIDGASLHASRGWVDAISALGVRTKYLALPGLIEMMMTAPQFATVPQAMLKAVRAWLLETRDTGTPRLADTGAPLTNDDAVPQTATLNLPAAGASHQAIAVERTALIDSHAMLFGIVTEPHPGEIRRRAVILLNAGADYHIGASRMHVSLARQWARNGYIVLRLDFSGVGDSDTEAGRPDDDVFPRSALDDIRAAIEFLRIRYGISDITLMGLCSGAYHALRAAVAGLPINRILMVNPQNFFWKEGTTLDELQLSEVVRNPGVYLERVFSYQAWRKLLNGRVNIWRIMMIYVQRSILALESSCRDLARWLHLRLPQDLGSELEEIAARGVRVVFVFARGEPGIGLLKIQGGSSVARLGDRCRVHIVDGGDHIFSQSGPRAAMEKILTDELFARTEWNG